jgi:hypothetical protein
MTRTYSKTYTTWQFKGAVQTDTFLLRLVQDAVDMDTVRFAISIHGNDAVVTALETACTSSRSNHSFVTMASLLGSTKTANASASPGYGGANDDKFSGILSSDQFSVSKYLNHALATTNQDYDLSQRMTELALQLQLQTQACHEDIGRIGAELQAILPRCAADIGRVGLGLDGLRLDAATLVDAISVNGETDVSSSLETLTTLHALQANLTRTKEILSAAATWDTTINSVNELLAAQNLAEAVNALARLESGEQALKGMPNPEQRQEQIAHIRQQVSAMLAPQLKYALANMSTRIAPLQQCVALYTKLNKMDSLKEDYVKNRPSGIHKAWFEFAPSNFNEAQHVDASKGVPGSNLATWLPGWFDAILSLLTEERRQSMAIFGPELVPEITIKVSMCTLLSIHGLFYRARQLTLARIAFEGVSGVLSSAFYIVQESP